MAVLLKKYANINDTLKHIKIQIIDSVDYAINECPQFESPNELFDWLMERVTYKNDPHNKELLQTLPTLLENNYHGIDGAGDCDCFTISTIALMIAQNWNGINIILAGRTKKCPVHIYCTIDWQGKRKVLDLTNKRYDVERPYPLTQKIPVRWKKW